MSERIEDLPDGSQEIVAADVRVYTDPDGALYVATNIGMNDVVGEDLTESMERALHAAASEWVYQHLTREVPT